MLRRILIAAAAAAMLLVTSFHFDDAFARGGRGGGFHGGGRGGFHGGGMRPEAFAAAPSVCAADAWPEAIEAPTEQEPIAAIVGAPIAATDIAATVSERRRSVPLRSEQLRPGLSRQLLRRLR